MNESPMRPRTALIPLLNVSAAPDLLALAASLIAGSDRYLPHAARIVVLAVVRVPEDEPPAEARNMARAYRAMLGYLPPTAGPWQPEDAPPAGEPPPQVPVHALIKVAPSLEHGIREAVTSEMADLLLLYWKGHANNPAQHVFGGTLDALLKNPPCNLLLARGGRWQAARRIVLPLRGGPGAELALETGLSLARPLAARVTVLHSVPTGESRTERDAPYLALQHRLQREAPDLAVEQVFTLTPDVPTLIADQVGPGDLVILGMADRGAHERLRRGPILSTILTPPERPVLLARAASRMDLAAYYARLKAAPEVAWSAEQWFVENTYRAEEFADPARWQADRRERQAHVTVVAPTYNDAGRITSLLMALRHGLQGEPAAPMIDETLVVDAGSRDNTPALAAAQNVPVLRPGPRSGPRPGPAALLRDALNVAMGDIVVWLDPKAGHLQPGYVPALVGPLLRDPNVLLVKPFWRAYDEEEQEADAAERGDTRFTQITVEDMLTYPVSQLMDVPPASWLRAFYPRLGALVSPLGRIFAARVSLLRELLPLLERFEAAAEADHDGRSGYSPGVAFLLGIVLETATRHGARAVAQVEMRRRARGDSVTVPSHEARHLGHIGEMLAFIATRPDTVHRRAAIHELRDRIFTMSA
jgi:glycosyltransferase involved in cell wall biosynthesis/nucleotide-binding universal stress UspA family protein